MVLSIIIVSYQCRDNLRITLDSILGSKTGFPLEVIIVDNGSSDGTVEMLRRDFVAGTNAALPMRLVENTNEGFSKGNNKGLKLATGEYLLLLNPDTKLSPDTLETMVNFMKQRPEVGIATCKLLKANGDLDKACRRSFPDPLPAFYRLSGLSLLAPKSKTLASYNLTYKDINQETEIDACSGAFLMMSRNCFEKVGPLDETFFMYGEDLDWCYQAKLAGFKVWYNPATSTIHYRGQSSKKTPGRVLYEFHRAMWLFYRKHYFTRYPRIFSGLVYTGIWGRYSVKYILNLLGLA